MYYINIILFYFLAMRNYSNLESPVNSVVFLRNVMSTRSPSFGEAGRKSAQLNLKTAVLCKRDILRQAVAKLFYFMPTGAILCNSMRN